MPFANPAQGNAADAQGPYDMFLSLPVITRCWFGITLVLTVAGNFKIIRYVPTKKGKERKEIV